MVIQSVNALYWKHFERLNAPRGFSFNIILPSVLQQLCNSWYSYWYAVFTFLSRNLEINNTSQWKLWHCHFSSRRLPEHIYYFLRSYGTPLGINFHTHHHYYRPVGSSLRVSKGTPEFEHMSASEASWKYVSTGVMKWNEMCRVG